MPVVVLKSEVPANIFCYCDGCGCAWRTPAEAKLESGVHHVTVSAHFAPNGVAMPTRLEVAAAGFADSILFELPSTDWETSIEEINRNLDDGKVGSTT